MEPLREKAKAARKQAEGANRDLAVAQAREIVDAHAKSSAPTKALIAMINGADAGALLAAIDTARAKLADTPVLFLSPDFDGGKVAIAATCPKSANDKGLKAGDWVKAAAQACGGAGGGRAERLSDQADPRRRALCGGRADGLHRPFTRPQDAAHHHAGDR